MSAIPPIHRSAADAPRNASDSPRNASDSPLSALAGSPQRVQKCVDAICERLTKETVIGAPTICVEELEYIGNIISDEIASFSNTESRNPETTEEDL